MNAPTQEQGVKLTRRELQVLTFIAEGWTSKEVADELCMSKRTVDFHLDNIYAALSAKNRIGAINRARAAGLLP